MKPSKSENEFIKVILKDVANNKFLFNERLPLHKVPNAIFSFFDRHFQMFAKESPKSFIVYLKFDSIPPKFMTAKLIVGELTQGHGDDEETFPYNLEHSELIELEPADAFPDTVSVGFGMRFQDVNSNRIEWEVIG